MKIITCCLYLLYFSQFPWAQGEEFNIQTYYFYIDIKLRKAPYPHILQAVISIFYLKKKKKKINKIDADSFSVDQVIFSQLVF